MPRWKALSFTLIFCLGIGSPATGSPATYQSRISGDSMSCLSWRGRPVQIISNYRLGTIGRASLDQNGEPIIEMNFGALGAFSPLMQKWWFAHECAHHQMPPQLNSEKRADCMAAKRLKKVAGMSVADVASSIERELSPLAASDHGHLAGPDRAKLVLKCAGLTRQA